MSRVSSLCPVVFLLIWFLCAPAAEAAYIHQTGQTLCYDTAGTVISCVGTGQNGEYASGASWPVNRLTVNGDQTITDAMTELVWPVAGNTPGPAACGPGVTKTALNAYNYINCLNSNSYLGHNDWRLPGIRELRSLINYGQSKQSTWLIAAGFTGIQNNNYWSSTTDAGSTPG